MDSKSLTHFVLPKNTEGNFKAKCKYCSSEISGSLKVTSNFATHMRRKHRGILVNLKSEVNEDKAATSQITNFVRDTAKYSSSDSRQLEITDALVSFIAGDLISLSVVDSKYFRNLMNVSNPKYQVPSRKHLTTKVIHDKFSKIKNGLQTELKLVQSVCVTLDLWSNRQMRSFLGITGHYISNWQMKSVMLACSRFKGKHTGENIREAYEETISTFEIEQKISNVVTDNAANMLKAFNFSLPGFECAPLGNESDEYDEIISEFCDGVEDMEEQDSIFDKFETFTKRNSCFAHTLQLTVKDGIGQCGGNLKQLISKASAIVNYVRKSVLATEILADEKRLQASNVTRWNSQYYMLKSILSVEEEKLNKLECPHKLSAYERKILSEICSILQPFEEATLEVQRKNTVSASLAVPLVIALKNKMQSISATYNSKIVNVLKDSLERRMSKYETDDDFLC